MARAVKQRARLEEIGDFSVSNDHGSPYSTRSLEGQRYEIACEMTEVRFNFPMHRPEK